MKSDSKIYIAGHSGLIGSAIVRRLKKEGFNNIIVKNRSEMDLLDQKQVRYFFENERPEYVFLAAAKVGGVYANSTYRADFIYENTMIECNVIHNAFQHEVRKLIFFSSSDVYPKECEQPSKEESLLTDLLEYSCEPYAIAKITGIKLCEAYNVQYGTDFVSLVCSNVYGRNQNYDALNSQVIPALIQRIHDAKVQNKSEVVIWGTGSAVRDFISADDVADASVFIMKNECDSYIYNVTSSISVSIKELTESICEVIGYIDKIIFDKTKPEGVVKKTLDGSRLRQLGWSASIGLEEGIKDSYHHFLEELKEKKVRYAYIKRVESGEKDISSFSKLNKSRTAYEQPSSYRDRVVIKPWGYEFLVLENECVALWFLHIKKGYSTSMHCHPQKKTSLILLSGRALSNTFNHREYLKCGSALIIEQGVFHSTKALSEDGILLLEVETPPIKTDLLRLRDRYGRENLAYEGTSEMILKDLQRYNYFYFEEDKKITKTIGESIVTLEKYNTCEELAKKFNANEDELITSCKGEILNKKGDKILSVGDTLKGQSLLDADELYIKEPLVLLRNRES